MPMQLLYEKNKVLSCSIKEGFNRYTSEKIEARRAQAAARFRPTEILSMGHHASLCISLKMMISAHSQNN